MSPQSAFDHLQNSARACTQCLDAGYKVVPGAVFSGNLSAQMMTIGQAPGPTEVTAKRPFNAGSGKRLFQWLGEAGFSEDQFRETQYMTSVTKCYPGRHAGGKGDRVPTKEEQALCRPYLLQEIALVEPRVLIPIGGLAIKLFYPAKLKLNELIGTANYFPPGKWHKDDPFSLAGSEKITELRSDMRSDAALEGRFVVPLPHPSGASLWPNKPENKKLIEQAIQLLAAIREGLQSG